MILASLFQKGGVSHVFTDRIVIKVIGPLYAVVV